jgi:hypothetical protein
MPSPEFGAGPVDPELQEQPVPTSEITKMAVITIANPNSLNNFLINYTPDYFILQFSYYISQSSIKGFLEKLEGLKKPLLKGLPGWEES